MRVFVVNSALPRSPLARFAAGVAVLLLIAGLVLVVLPLAGLALLLALAGGLLIAVARWLWSLGVKMPGQGPDRATGGAAHRPGTRHAQDVTDVEFLEPPRPRD
jgi:hypothetical protein